MQRCARGPPWRRRDAVVPTMVFLSRYVVGGVARNVQGNEHLALLPIPFQLPVVGAQEKEGREARVVAGGRARPQRRQQQQQHGQDESPRRPAAALHAAALRAAARPARSLIHFRRHRQGEAARGEGEPAAGSSRAAPGNRARGGNLAGDRGSRSYFGPRERERGGHRDRGRRERVVRLERRRSRCARDAPRPGLGKCPPPPHLLKAPGAAPSPAAATRVPAAPPLPRRSRLLGLCPHLRLRPAHTLGSRPRPALPGPEGQDCPAAARTVSGRGPTGCPGESESRAHSCPFREDARGSRGRRGPRRSLSAPAAPHAPRGQSPRGPRSQRLLVAPNPDGAPRARALSSQASRSRHCPRPGP